MPARSADPAARPVILVVEDNPDGREALLMLLRAHGLRTEEAADGGEGVRVGLALRPSAAVVDVNMPVLDGFEVAAILRRSLGRSVLLIAHTGNGDPTYRERAALAGFDHFLVKPCDPCELLALLSQDR